MRIPQLILADGGALIKGSGRGRGGTTEGAIADVR